MGERVLGLVFPTFELEVPHSACSEVLGLVFTSGRCGPSAIVSYESEELAVCFRSSLGVLLCLCGLLTRICGLLTGEFAELQTGGSLHFANCPSLVVNHTSSHGLMRLKWLLLQSSD